MRLRWSAPKLLEMVTRNEFDVEPETAGTVAPDMSVDGTRATVSPAHEHETTTRTTTTART
jgi:hypothetical protein